MASVGTGTAPEEVAVGAADKTSWISSAYFNLIQQLKKFQPQPFHPITQLKPINLSTLRRILKTHRTVNSFHPISEMEF